MYLPKRLQITTKIWNKDCIQFNNNTKIIIGNYNANSIRGRSIDLLVLDEAAFVKNKDFKEFIMSVFPVQCSRKDSQMIIISTPNKVISEFHKLYDFAKYNKTSFTKGRRERS